MTEPLVLYAEDDPNDAFFMRRAFREAGIPNLLVVEDGRAVVDYLCGRAPFQDPVTCPPPTLVLLDINMPRLSGLETLAWIRGHPVFIETPVVILTSSSHPKDISRAYETGATAFFLKPGGATALVDVAKALRGILMSGQIREADFDQVPGCLKRPGIL